MIERHVTFHVLPDKTGDFEKLFVESYRPAMASMPGFVKVELLVDQETPNDYLMVIRFQSEESAAAWRNSELHQALKPKIKSLYTASQLKVFEVKA